MYNFRFTSSIGLLGLLLVQGFILRYSSGIHHTCPIGERRYENFDANNDEIRLDTRDPVRRVGEISGLAFSPNQLAPSGEYLIYAMGDGGALERFGLWDPLTGERLMTLQISNKTTINGDWESMTIGSCGNTGVKDTCLYIVDSGDNTARNSDGRRSRREVTGNPYRILKIKEPMLSDYEDNDFIPSSDISILNYDYFHESSPSKFADCEAMFIDHTGWGEDGAIGDIYLVTKWNRKDSLDRNRLFKIPPSAWPETYNASVGHYSPAIAGNDDNYMWESPKNLSDLLSNDWYKGTGYQSITGGHFMGMQWRSAEMSFDGSLIALGTTSNVTIFLREQGQSVLDALAAPNARSRWCMIWDNPVRGQMESLAISPDGKNTLNVPEGNRPRLGWTELFFNESNITSVPTNVTIDIPIKTINLTSSCPALPLLCDVVIGVKENLADGTLEECQSDCDRHRECAGNLICYQRDKGTKDVPGCIGDADLIGNGKHDFCIRPVAISILTSTPTIVHSISPSIDISSTPTIMKSKEPSNSPSKRITISPSYVPTEALSDVPSDAPSMIFVDRTFTIPSEDVEIAIILAETSGNDGISFRERIFIKRFLTFSAFSSFWFLWY